MEEKKYDVAAMTTTEIQNALIKERAERDQQTEGLLREESLLRQEIVGLRSSKQEIILFFDEKIRKRLSEEAAVIFERKEICREYNKIIDPLQIELNLRKQAANAEQQKLEDEK